MTFFSRCILAFLIAAIASELVQARGRRSDSKRPKLKAFPKGNKELLVRVTVVYEKKYVGLYVAIKKNATCIADPSVPHELFNRSRENELLERAERTLVQLQYFGVLDRTIPLKPEDLMRNYRELVNFCALKHDVEKPYKDGQVGFLKSEDSEYSFPSFSASSSGDPLPENATVPTRDDDGYPQVPGCKLEKVDIDNKRGRGCRRYLNSDGQECVECLYHDCSKKALGEGQKKHTPPTSAKPTEPKPTEPKPTEPKVLPEPHVLSSQEQTEAARGSDAAKEAEREARKEARKAEKQAERKREREAKKKHKAKSQ